MIAIALLLPTLFGFLVLSLLLKGEQSMGLLERISWAFPLGSGLMTIQMFILGLLRVPLTLGYTVLPLAIEIILLSFWVAKEKILLFPPLRFELMGEVASPQTSFIRKSALVLLIIWAGAKLLSVFVETWLTPIFAWDAWANWSTGAKLFYFTKSLLLDAPPQDFFTRGAVLRITSYPLHNPLMQVWMSLWTGSFDEVLVKFWSPVYLLSLAVSLYVAASREISRLAALGLLVMFLSSPLLSLHATEVYSDLPLGVCLLMASVSFLNAMRGKHAFWILLALFSAEAIFTKDEALFFVAPLILSALVFVWHVADTAGQRGKRVVSFIAPLVIVAPWYLFKLSHGLGLGADTIHLKFTFHPEIIQSAVMQVLSLANFNLFFVYLPILIIACGKPAREFLYLSAPVACYALFFLMLYLFTTDYYDHFNRGTVFSRNLLTYYPIIFLLTVLSMKRLYLRGAAAVQET